jgi:hypothetical protein
MFKRIKNQLKNGRGRKLVWLTIALLLITFGLTVSARTWMSVGSPDAKSLHTPTAPQNSLSAQEQERGVIRLLTSGFSPTEVSGLRGQYRLVTTRPSQGEEVVLQLKTATGELVQEIEMPQEKADWTSLIELEAGSYTLTVVNHPQWTCHISVQ